MTTTVLVIDVYVGTYLAGYGQYPSSDIIQKGVTYLHPLTLYMKAIRSYRHVLEPKRVCDVDRLSGLQRRSTIKQRIGNSRSESIDDLRTLLKI
jgi:hypothetical protein